MSRLAEAMSRANMDVDVQRAAPAQTIQWEPPPPAAASDEPSGIEGVSTSDAAAAASDSVPRIHATGTSLVAERLVVTPDISPVSLEQYRRLAATLHRQQTERGIKSVMVASTLPGEGKTLTAVNLALTFSESYGRQVLLIDGDLRRPTTHDVLDVPNLLGQSAGLARETDQKLSLIRVSPRLSVLTAGQPDPDPMGRLTSDRMRHVMAEAAAQFDWVIIDTPPVGKVPDANLLAVMADVVVLVVQAGRTPVRMIQRTAEAVGVQRVIGVVLNRADERIVAGESATAYGYERYAPNA